MKIIKNIVYKANLNKSFIKTIFQWTKRRFTPPADAHDNRQQKNFMCKVEFYVVTAANKSKAVIINPDLSVWYSKVRLLHLIYDFKKQSQSQ